MAARDAEPPMASVKRAAPMPRDFLRSQADMAVARRLHSPTSRAARSRARGPEIAAIQRKRMLTAAIEAVQEVGYTGFTVAQVTARAGVSRKTFYELFADREDCFLAAFEQTLERMRLLVSEAYAEAPGWREGVRAGLAAIIEFIEVEPALAELCIAETRNIDAKPPERLRLAKIRNGMRG